MGLVPEINKPEQAFHIDSAFFQTKINQEATKTVRCADSSADAGDITTWTNKLDKNRPY